jgi:selenium metabolism protein YedF
VRRIDCRNMACPLPVVTVKRAIEEPGDAPLTVLLDDGAPRENVKRFLAGRGYCFTEEPAETGFALVVSGRAVTESACGKEGAAVILVGTDALGEGPEDLGRLLMKNFLITLLDVGKLPEKIFFLNRGVFLATEGSEALEALTGLENRGVGIFSCGVCLDFYHLKEKLRAGGVTNMLTIAESLLSAPSAVRL